MVQAAESQAVLVGEGFHTGDGFAFPVVGADVEHLDALALFDGLQAEVAGFGALALFPERSDGGLEAGGGDEGGDADQQLPVHAGLAGAEVPELAFQRADLEVAFAGELPGHFDGPGGAHERSDLGLKERAAGLALANDREIPGRANLDQRGLFGRDVFGFVRFVEIDFLGGSWHGCYSWGARGR